MTSTRAVGRPHWGIFLGLAAGVVALDQLSKAWLAANVAPGEVLELLGSWLRLIYSENDGGLFGLFQGNAALFAAVSIVVVGLIVAFHARSPASRSTSIALGLLLGGAVGNLIDRVRLGYVLDFVDMGIGDIRFYTYNLADAAITTAIIALIVLALFPAVGEAIDGLGRAPAPTTAPPPDAPPPTSPLADAAGHDPAVPGEPRLDG